MEKQATKLKLRKDLTPEEIERAKLGRIEHSSAGAIRKR